MAESKFYDAYELSSNDEDDLFDEFYTLMAAQHDNKYHLPNNVFHGLSKEARTMFYHMQDDLTTAQKQLASASPSEIKGGTEDNKPQESKPKVEFHAPALSTKQQLPQQYPKAIKTHIADTTSTITQDTFESTLDTKAKARLFLKEFDELREKNRTIHGGHGNKGCSQM